MYHDKNYTYYKEARDAAWTVLIQCNITSLPVSLTPIAKLFNIYVIPYSSGYRPNSTAEDGFSFCRNNKTFIFYNDKKPSNRIRFTLAHELGHCILGHVSNSETYHRNSEYDFSNMDIKEMQANVFARDLLMPATVLHSIGVSSAKEISALCKVSMQSAEIRYNSLLELNKRGLYNKHPLERQVYDNFRSYIKKALDTGTI